MSEAGGGLRTPDLLITNQLLYLLSYASKRAFYKAHIKKDLTTQKNLALFGR
jgi:hypothetical protein